MSQVNKKTAQMTQLTLLIAILVVLTFTPLGFIQIPPVAITILHIPVIIGAITMGSVCGGILGLAFGVLSMLKATFMGVSPVDLMFSPFASGAPIQSLVMCILPRVLLGVIAGVLYEALKSRLSNDALSIGISAGIATLCHTIMVMGCLWFFFSAIPLKEVFLTIVGVNGLLELGVGIVITIAVCKPLMKYLKTRVAV